MINNRHKRSLVSIAIFTATGKQELGQKTNIKRSSSFLWFNPQRPNPKCQSSFKGLCLTQILKHSSLMSYLCLEFGTCDGRSMRDIKYSLQVLTKTARDALIYSPKGSYNLCFSERRLAFGIWMTYTWKAFLHVNMVTLTTKSLTVWRCAFIF